MFYLESSKNPVGKKKEEICVDMPLKLLKTQWEKIRIKLVWHMLIIVSL